MKELTEKSNYSLKKLFSTFSGTGIWVISNGLANSKRTPICTIGHNPKKLPDGAPKKHVLLNYGAHYQNCTYPSCRYIASYG